MRIRITTTFTDKQATDPDKAEVAAGSEITVTAERGAELVGLGLAEEIDGTPAKAPRKQREKKVVEPAPVVASTPAPAPAPAAAPVSGPDPAAPAGGE